MSDIANLTLWDIETDLLALLDLREEMQAKNEPLEPVDAQIVEYVAREIQKVDRIRGFLKHCALLETGAKDEAASYRARAEMWGNRAKRLKEFCLQALRMADKKKIEGLSGSISRQADGGRQAVEITDLSLIPEEMVQYEGRISGEAWALLEEVIYQRSDKPGAPTWEWWKGRQDVQMSRVPMTGKIGAALAERCGQCLGSKVVIGIENGHEYLCPVCGGDGLARVPGARLVPRGEHCVIR